MRPTSATVSDTFSSVLCRISRIVLWKSSRKHVVSQSPDVDSSVALISVISGQINSSPCSSSDMIRRGISATAERLESVTLLCSCLPGEE